MADFARSTHPGVQAQLDRLPALSTPGDSLGLTRIRALLDRLGRPQDSLPPVLHVAGTNGKGSTCAMLRAALEAAGHRVHAFTSPHLVRFNERIRVAGTLIDDAMLEALLAEAIDAGDGIAPTFFEVATAAAFLAFARIPADACVIEVGLGGRLDATNVIDSPLVCGIAAIGFDHQQYLGHTLGEIAAEKAGIARAGVSLVSLAQPPEAQAAIACVAGSVNAPLLVEGRDWQADLSFEPNLRGAHQIRNASLAWQMVAAQDQLAVPRAAFLKGIGNVRWPARFQRLRDDVATWVDGAHNPQAATALGELLATTGPMHLILGILANKDADAIVAALARHALSLTFVPVPDHAHHDPAELAKRFGGAAAQSLDNALADVPGPRLIAGSLYLAGLALALTGELPD
ncbi:MAG: folylpolyglutamate synthase/dihydrofolate synthase family protein [Sphingomicrobium sp.]